MVPHPSVLRHIRRHGGHRKSAGCGPQSISYHAPPGGHGHLRRHTGGCRKPSGRLLLIQTDEVPGKAHNTETHHERRTHGIQLPRRRRVLGDGPHDVPLRPPGVGDEERGHTGRGRAGTQPAPDAGGLPDRDRPGSGVQPARSAAGLHHPRHRHCKKERTWTRPDLDRVAQPVGGGDSGVPVHRLDDDSDFETLYMDSRIGGVPRIRERLRW